MPMTRTCAECGATLAGDTAAGACPVCALRGALELSGATAEVVVTEKPGDQIGHYKLLEKIGEGGCGIVYMAEQIKPIRRRVALKIVKLGMDTRQVIARFEAERQALALMDHPNIAKVLDAGATDTGRPYFVMELVRGIKITDYCDQHHLSTPERLDLFMQVCHAIQHAHQKGIIHRDIKPSNILVTLLDGVPIPKVIDFGIAKATQQPLTDKTLFTGFHQFIGTPAYMSPEQAEMGPQDIDTRSDIYALGVLLYELLTGRLPFEQKEMLEAGLDEMRRLIREKEPPKPSTRLSTLAHGDLTAIARSRQTEPPRLLHLVRGDLDWIVMKCLEKDRARRYDTPNGLARDLERHLNHEPVTAAAPSPFYRMGKFVRRHRVGLATAAALLVLVVAGVVASVWQAVRATKAEGQARTVATFLKNMLNGVRPSRALGRDTKMLREILDRTAGSLGKDLRNQPAVEAELRSTVGGVYLDLGEYEKAETMHRAALALRKEVFGYEHPDVAESLDELGNALYRQSKLTEAETTHREALALRRKLLGSRHPKVAASLNNLANTLREQGRLAEAEAMFREALVLRRELLGSNHAETAETVDNLGAILSLQDKFQEAETMQREALALDKRLLGNDHPDVALSLNNLADTLTAEGKLDEAEARSREALALRRKVLGAEHPDVAFSLFNLANVLLRQDKLADAEAAHREALAMRRKLLGNDHLAVAGSLNNVAAVLIAEDKLAEAETAQREALAIQRKALGGEHQDIAGSLANLAYLLQRRGQLAEAEATQREALAMRRKLLGNEHSDVAASLAGLADVLYDQHKLAEAEALQREELAMRREWLSKTSPHLPALVNNLVDAFFRLTRTVLAAEEFAEAERLAREWLALGEKELPDDWQTFNARSMLGSGLLGQRKFTEAEPPLVFGYDGMNRRQEKVPPEYKFRLRESLECLVRLYQATGRPDQAAEWKKKLANYSASEPDQKANAPKPQPPLPGSP